MHYKIEKGGRTFYFEEILPDNDRVNKMRKEQAEIDRKLKIEEAQKKKQEEELNKPEEEENLDLEPVKNDDLTEFDEEDILQQIEKIKKRDNNLNLIMRSLIDNVSPYELNFAGIDLDLLNILTLMNILKTGGKTLHTLNLSRKNLDDSHAGVIANMLRENKTLRRLELEGNNFGPDGLKKIADALRTNSTLRYLDLENNNLTNSFEDTTGVEELFEVS